MAETTCLSCGHSHGEHFRDVEGSVHCLHWEFDGVWLQFVKRCECIDFKSKEQEEKKQEEQRQRTLLDKAAEQTKELHNDSGFWDD